MYIIPITSLLSYCIVIVLAHVRKDKQSGYNFVTKLIFFMHAAIQIFFVEERQHWIATALIRGDFSTAASMAILRQVLSGRLHSCISHLSRTMACWLRLCRSSSKSQDPTTVAYSVLLLPTMLPEETTSRPSPSTRNG